LKIADRFIGKTSPPFVIAEMSGNHNQSLAKAIEIVEAVAKSGAHGLKIQTYTPDTMTLDLNEGEFCIKDSKSLWVGKSLYELYGEAYTPWEWHKSIFDRARELGLIAFSSPFDDTAVDFLEDLGVPCYKIASFEIVDLNLIRRVASTGKPVIISTGMANIAEIDEAVRVARKAGCKDLALLKCTSTYPAPPGSTNLLTIPHMKELFQCEVGLSDHTMGIGASVASVGLGASVIEKHFTLNRAEGGVDSIFSMEPSEMALLVEESQRAWEAMGSISYGVTEAERQSLLFRRSLYIVRDMSAGEVLNAGDVRSIRPGLGLPPKYLEAVIGMRVNINIRRGTPVKWDLLR